MREGGMVKPVLDTKLLALFVIFDASGAVFVFFTLAYRRPLHFCDIAADKPGAQTCFVHFCDCERSVCKVRGGTGVCSQS